MSFTEAPRIGIAVMYHPSRSASAHALARQCAALDPDLVVDPDPTSFPSPLRTAKRAWAAVRPDVTHHLVLQDDVVLAADFLEHLHTVVAGRPHDGIALYVNRGSLRNGYFARRAAALGSPWSPLSGFEYLPTLGFLLPAGPARELAAFMHTFPDEFRADDEVVARFCRGRGLPVVAAVPNLVDHGSRPSIAGNDEHGERRTVAFADHADLPDGYWRRPPATGQAPDVPPHALELFDSRCLIRFVRPGTAEPVDSLYGWYWHDWCSLLGVAADHVLSTWRDHLDRLAGDVAGGRFPIAASAEAWAAGYLLGRDAAGAGADSTPALRPAVESWLAAGLAPADRDGLTPDIERILTGLCLAAVAVGAKSRAAAWNDR
jgi:hypothetical protein